MQELFGHGSDTPDPEVLETTASDLQLQQEELDEVTEAILGFGSYSLHVSKTLLFALPSPQIGNYFGYLRHKSTSPPAGHRLPPENCSSFSVAASLKYLFFWAWKNLGGLEAEINDFR